MKSALITSSILILVIAALRPLLRGRVDPRVQYALWLAVALRLLIPVNLTDSAYSAMALLERAEEPTQLVESIGQTTVPILGISYEDAYDRALREYHRDKASQTNFTDLDEVERRAQELQAKSPTLAELVTNYAKPVWLGGATLMGLWFLLVNLRLRRKLRTALPVEADCSLPVRVSPELLSPCLCGAVRPVIYVTPDALVDPARVRHVLTHELTHYRHRDHWWALVRCLCLCFYWFDPLVWWAAAMSRQDCELACDAGAIRRLGEEERIPYGRTLVAMIAAGRNSLFQTATTMTGGKRRVRERVELIARRPKTVIALALAAALLLGLTACFTFTGAPEQMPSQSLSMGTLQERLLDVPEELQADVLARTTDQSEIPPLASYWMNRDWEQLDEGLGFLLSVRQLSYTEFMDAFEHNAGGWEGFARSGDTYFAIAYATDVRYYTVEDAEPFHNTFDAIREYAMRQVLSTEGVEPFDPEKAAGPLRTVQAVMDEIAYAPSASFVLYIPEDGLNPRQYDTEMSPDGYWSKRVRGLAANAEWEDLTMEQAAELMEQGSGVSLQVAPSGGAMSSACVTVYEGSQLVAVRTVGNEMKWYKARCLDSSLDYAKDRIFYDYLRWWYDEVELSALRPTTVPDRGQSHEEVAREWAENWEGALTKITSGNAYACTYVRVESVQADCHSYMDEEQLDAFAKSRDLAAADYGKTWFTFAYQTVFVPVDQSESSALWAGNTGYYEGGDAPEGAWIYEHVGYMFLTGEGWFCEGVGTGW